MDNQLKTNLLNPDIWIRLLFMFVFMMVLYVVGAVFCIVVVLQFLIVLVVGDRNNNLNRLSIMLGTYLLQIVDFLTFATELKPFPFGDFPDDSREPEETDD